MIVPLNERQEELKVHTNLSILYRSHSNGTLGYVSERALYDAYIKSLAKRRGKRRRSSKRKVIKD